MLRAQQVGVLLLPVSALPLSPAAVLPDWLTGLRLGTRAARTGTRSRPLPCRVMSPTCRSCPAPTHTRDRPERQASSVPSVDSLIAQPRIYVNHHLGRRPQLGPKLRLSRLLKGYLVRYPGRGIGRDIRGYRARLLLRARAQGSGQGRARGRSKSRAEAVTQARAQPRLELLRRYRSEARRA